MSSPMKLEHVQASGFDKAGDTVLVNGKLNGEKTILVIPREEAEALAEGLLTQAKLLRQALSS